MKTRPVFENFNSFVESLKQINESLDVNKLKISEDKKKEIYEQEEPQLWFEDLGLNKSATPNQIIKKYKEYLGKPLDTRIQKDSLDALIGKDIYILQLPSGSEPNPDNIKGAKLHKKFTVKSAYKGIYNNTPEVIFLFDSEIKTNYSPSAKEEDHYTIVDSNGNKVIKGATLRTTGNVEAEKVKLNLFGAPALTIVPIPNNPGVSNVRMSEYKGGNKALLKYDNLDLITIYPDIIDPDGTLTSNIEPVTSSNVQQKN